MPPMRGAPGKPPGTTLGSSSGTQRQTTPQRLPWTPSWPFRKWPTPGHPLRPDLSRAGKPPCLIPDRGPPTGAPCPCAPSPRKLPRADTRCMRRPCRSDEDPPQQAFLLLTGMRTPTWAASSMEVRGCPPLDPGIPAQWAPPHGRRHLQSTV